LKIFKSPVKRRTLIVLLIIIASGVGVSAYYMRPSNAEAKPFQLKVTNRPAFFGVIVYSIPGQRCMFLVTLIENQTSTESGAVKLTATSLDCEVSVYPQSITHGQVAEITVMPITDNVGRNVTITLTGERGGLKRIVNISTEVLGEEDMLGPEAAEKRDMFVAWLAVKHPELGITDKTVWTGTVVNPRVLVVTHYMFLSEEWEMYLTWHVMIPPYDWAKIYLRHRFDNAAPTYAFEISSLQEQSEPGAIEVPDWV
jgi:hypothetical protein